MDKKETTEDKKQEATPTPDAKKPENTTTPEQEKKPEGAATSDVKKPDTQPAESTGKPAIPPDAKIPTRAPTAVSTPEKKPAAAPVDSTAAANFAHATRIPIILLRVGLAFVFTYAAISMAAHPENFTHFLPFFLSYVPFFTASSFLHVFGAFEIILSLWLLSGKWGLYASFVAVNVLYGITAFNLENFNIIFRNVAIFTGACALMFLEWEKRKKLY